MKWSTRGIIGYLVAWYGLSVAVGVVFLWLFQGGWNNWLLLGGAGMMGVGVWLVTMEPEVKGSLWQVLRKENSILSGWVSFLLICEYILLGLILARVLHAEDTEAGGLYALLTGAVSAIVGLVLVIRARQRALDKAARQSRDASNFNQFHPTA